MNRYRSLLAALLFAALGAAPAAYLDGVIGSGTRSDGGGGTIGSGTRTDGTSFLDENRGGYFGSGH